MLRDYQQEDMQKLIKSLNSGHKRILFEAATSYGKSYFALEFIKRCLTKGRRIIFCTNRSQLIDQIRDDFTDISDYCSVLKSGKDSLFDLTKPVQIIMLQSFYSRQDAIDDFCADVVIIDEVHLMYGGNMMTKLIEKNWQARVIGLTATGIDEKGYRLEGFDDIIETYQVPQLIEKGYLAEAECYTSKNAYDLTGVRICGNDYNQQDIERLVLDYTQVSRVVDAWEQKAKNKKTIVFVNNIKQGEELAKEFERRGYEASLLHSKIANLEQYRDNLLSSFRRGEKRIIINVQMLVEGFSDKEVECILLALLTRVQRKVLQIYGRGLRRSETKKRCIFIDCGGNFALHGLPTDFRAFRTRLKKIDTCTVKQCAECGAIVDKNVNVCPYCGYDFGVAEECDNKDNKHKPTKKQIEQLEKARDLQGELRLKIQTLVIERGYKKGYGWFLFIACLKTKRPTESIIQFFNRKLTRIKRVKQRHYKLAYMQYD